MQLVAGVFATFGFTCHLSGSESDTEALRTALRGQTDRTSLMIRFRPDRVFVCEGIRSVLCEVKHEPLGRPNFAVEVDSYRAALDHSAAHLCVVLALVDLRRERVWCCWVTDVPPPATIYVPRRWDFAANRARMAAGWPDACLVDEPHRGGSGTPYFLLPKRSPFLLPADQFIVTKLGERTP